MAGRIRGWWALPGSERWLLVALLTALPIVAVSLRCLGYQRTLRWLERISVRAQPRVASVDDFAAAERLAQLTHIAGHRGLISATCLRQSLVIHTLLRRRGLRPELKLGVRKHGEQLDAHAWVELDGRALSQQQPGYAVLNIDID